MKSWMETFFKKQKVTISFSEIIKIVIHYPVSVREGAELNTFVASEWMDHGRSNKIGRI